MPYVAPSTVVAGQTYGASAHNVIVNDIIDHESRINQYAGVYTNEAARDAAIPSPSEGMRVYLTAPTVPAATANSGSGGYTAVPTGVTTIYNGSVWVCTTEVGAGRHGVTSYTTTSSSYVTTLTGDSTAISVTLVTGTSALVSLAGSQFGTGYSCSLTISVSGATTLAASVDRQLTLDQSAGPMEGAVAATYVLTGLTAGTNTFTLNYVVHQGTGTWLRRHLTVKGIA